MAPTCTFPKISICNNEVLLSKGNSVFDEVFFFYSTLPPQFPQDAPVVTVEPPVRHPWVDTQMKVTGCANINNVSFITYRKNSYKCPCSNKRLSPMSDHKNGRFSDDFLKNQCLY